MSSTSEFEDAIFSQTADEIIDQITDTRTQDHVRIAACLLGVSQDMPEVSADEINQQHAVQACYGAIAGVGPDFAWPVSSTTFEDEIVPFQIPMNAAEAGVEVPQNDDKLGWGLSTSHRTLGRLLTLQDADTAPVAAQGTRVGQNQVAAGIVNTAPAIAQTGSKCKRGAEDPSDLYTISYMQEFEHVKEKLRCSAHRGEYKWCWVDPITPGAQHIPLCFHDIQLWAKYLHEHPADMTCTVLPNERHFIELRRTRKSRATPLSRTPTDPVISTMTPLTSNVPGPGLARQFAFYLESDESDDGNEVDIKELLDTLAAKFTSLDFHQYEHRLRMLGISYLIIAAMFELEFFISKVGMSEGAARLFCYHVVKEMGKREGKEKEKKSRMVVND